MTRTIAFLRAINVGGHTVKMDTLRLLFEEMGFADVETFIASGNVIFRSDASDHVLLQPLIEARLLSALGYEVATFLRTDAEVAAIAAYQPFPEPEMDRAVALNVGFMAGPVTRAAEAAIMALKTENDDFHLHGREIYWLGRKKQSESTISGAVLEKAVAGRVTMRGMNTIQRLTAKYSPAGSASGAAE